MCVCTERGCSLFDCAIAILLVPSSSLPSTRHNPPQAFRWCWNCFYWKTVFLFPSLSLSPYTRTGFCWFLLHWGFLFSSIVHSTVSHRQFSYPRLAIFLPFFSLLLSFTSSLRCLSLSLSASLLFPFTGNSTPGVPLLPE